MTTQPNQEQRNTRRILVPSVLAGSQRWNRKRLWKGLERFVNCSDSLEDYYALKNSFPELFPVGVGLLAWHPICHKLFLVYRDKLRKVWVTRRWKYHAGDLSGFLLGLTDENKNA